MSGKQQRRLKRVNRRQLLGVVLAAAAALIVWRLAAPSGGELSVRFEGPDGRSPSFSLRVAADEGQRVRGLQFVKTLGEREGMLFVFPREEPRAFWMKDTYIPLDMLFLDSRRRVVGILENVEIMTTDSRRVNRPSMYVIELPAGSASRFGIKEGSTALFAAEPPAARN